MLSQNDMVPLYQQLKAKIKDSIVKGEIKPGEKIFTEVELGEKYNVSRITVRSAINELVDEGLLTKKQGKGTFVSNVKIDRELAKFTGFTSTCKMLGLTPSSKVIKKEVIAPSLHDIAKLNLEEGDRLVFIQRIRYADSEPVMIEDTYFSYNKYHFLLTEDGLEASLYELLLKKYNIKLCKGENSVQIFRATEYEAQYLNVSKGHPLLLLNGTAYDDKNIPIHYGKEYINGDKYTLSFTNNI